MKLPPCACGGMLVAAALAATPAALPAQSDAPPALTLEAVVRTTLRDNPDLAIEAWEVERSRGALEGAKGAFDPAVWAGMKADRERAWAEPGESPTASATQGYRVGVTHRLRAGILLEPHVAVTHSDGALLGTAPYSRTDLNVGVALPLLRGRGDSPLLATERAATHALAASSATLRHLRAEAVRRSAAAYWEYLAASQRLTVLREAEARAAKLLSDTETLIRADERAAVDAIPVRANLASKRAARIAGEQGLLAARQGLALAMGTPAAEFTAMPPPGTEFPRVADTDRPDLPPVEALVDRALRTRWDLAAAGRHRSAAQEFLRGSRSAQRPQLDLRVTVGVSNRDLGPDPTLLTSPLPGSRSGLHGEVDLSYGIPLGNRAARGDVVETAAAVGRMDAAVAEMRRAITLEVLTAAETYRSARLELRQAEEALRLHQQSVEAEQMKFRLGSATLFDVIFAEDALTAATLQEIEARTRLAAALARLQFQTGGLDVDEETGEGDWTRRLTRVEAPYDE